MFVRLSVCMCVYQGGPNHDRYEQRLVILHGNADMHAVQFPEYSYRIFPVKNFTDTRASNCRLPSGPWAMKLSLRHSKIRTFLR